MAGDIEKVTGKRGEYYRVRVELPPRLDGKRNQRTLTDKSYKALERQQRDLLYEIDQGRHSVAPVKTTLGEFLDFYLDIVKGKRDSTYNGYRKSFNAFRKCLGDGLRLTDIKTDTIQVAVNRLSDNLKNSSVERYFVNLKTAFKYAANPGVGYVAFNPCEGVIINKPDNVEKVVWDDDQSNQFIRFCKLKKQRYSALFVLLLKTGARIGEILALRWTDVNFEAGMIYITRTVSGTGRGYNPPKSKNGTRKVPLDEGTLSMLNKHRIHQAEEKLLHGEGWNTENLVFCTKTGQRETYSEARRIFEELCMRAGLPYIAPHGMRHTHASFLLLHGRSVKEVAERLGDDDKTIMKTYSHLLPHIQAETVKLIEQIYEQ